MMICRQGKQIRHFADGRDVLTCGEHAIEKGFRRGRHRVIVTVRRALKGAGQADERPRNHPAQAETLHRQAVGDVAPLIKLRHSDDAFVRGDLEHAVGRRVDDRPAGPHVLRAELVRFIREYLQRPMADIESQSSR